MAGTSSSSFQRNYDVFLSFRGEDTRNNFTAHLYKELHAKGINTFIDDEKLERGEVISPALVTAIEKCMFFIVILSENYASSKWCLEELVKILECKKTRGQAVLPIFYNIDPSVVRKQEGSFGAALRKHEENLKENIERVHTWRAALTEVANLSGWDSRNKQEPMLIKEVVTNILNRLLSITSSDAVNLVGIESSINDVELLLSIETLDVRMVGICGMGGIGKTTLAKAIYDHIFNQFEACSFLEDNGDFNDLQMKFLSKLLGERDLSCTGLTSIKARLEFKKVLVVIDNVNNLKILEVLVGKQNWFGPGSRIIITTRDKHLLVTHGVKEVYEVKKLKDNDAVVLFSRYAFKQDHPFEDYVELSERVLVYAQGLPLALKVLGSFLFGRSKLDWESALAKLHRIADEEIQKVLQVSFDDLNEEEKDIFLDIACFFKGEDEDHVIKILDSCGFSTRIGMTVLTDKSLITVSDNELWMHDLLQQMGWEIVRQTSKEVGKRSRLWLPEDVYHVLTENTGTEQVEGIFLDLSKLKEIEFNTETFGRMNNLRLLKLYKSRPMAGMDCRVHLTLGSGLPLNRLRYLYWHEFPLKIWPPDFHPKYLAELHMQFSHLEQLWKGNKSLEKLELIELSHSKYLLATPDFSGVPNLERLILDGCTQLCKVHPSLGFLKKLIFLNLKGCINLTTFPSSVELESPEVLILSGCSKFNKFPEILGPMKSLSKLYLDGTAINELPSSIENASGLVSLVLEDCKSFKQLPRTICKLKSLESLTLSGCLKFEHFPEIMANMEILKQLVLNGTAINRLPSSVECLIGLVSLNLRNCKNLVSLPSTLCNLKSLEILEVSGCSRLEQLPEDLAKLECLTELYAGRTSISQAPVSMVLLRNLKVLSFAGCKGVPTSSSWGSYLSSCFLPRESSDSIIFRLPPLLGLRNLTGLDISDCNLSEVPADIGSLSSLAYLNLSRNNFVCLPSNICQLSHLWYLGLSHCKMLQVLPMLPPCTAVVDTHACESLEMFYFNPSIWTTQHWFKFTNCFKLKIQLFQSSEFLVAINFAIRYLNPAGDCRSLFAPLHLHKTFSTLLSHRLFQEADYADWERRLKAHDAISFETEELKDDEADYEHREQRLKAHALLSHRLRPFQEADYEEWERRLKARDAISFETEGPKVDPSLTFGYSNIEFSTFVPGSEIPNWFLYQGTGSSLNIDVDQEELVGLAISAVVELKEAIDENLVSIIFDLTPEDDGNFHAIHASHFTNVIDCGDEERFVVESDHLWFGFHTFEHIYPRRTSTSFRASFRVGGLPHKVKGCGIHPFYKNQVFGSLVQFRELFEDLDKEKAHGSGYCRSRY